MTVARNGAEVRGRERILFVELWRLGDAVSATAGLRALRRVRPNAEIAVLAHSQHGDPLLRSKDADQQLRFDAFWTRGRLPRDKYVPWTIDYGELVRAAQSIRAFRADHVLLFRGDIREQLFFRTLGARNVVDLKGPLPILPGIATNPRPSNVPRWKEYVYHVQQWSGTSIDAEPSIADVREKASSHPYVLLHPGASWQFKRWKAQNVAALIRILRNQDVEVTIVAGATDRAFLASVSAEYGEELAVAYPTLEELYSLIADARAVICNNSAALHIAEAVHTPCIALTGPSDPVRWGTYRAHSRTICRSEELACHPCGEKRCVLPATPCIDRISVGEVVEALTELGVAPARGSYERAPR